MKYHKTMGYWHMADIAAANIEQPCQTVRQGDDRRVLARVLERARDILTLLQMGFAGVFFFIGKSICHGRLWLIRPDKVD